MSDGSDPGERPLATEDPANGDAVESTEEMVPEGDDPMDPPSLFDSTDPRPAMTEAAAEASPEGDSDSEPAATDEDEDEDEFPTRRAFSKPSPPPGEDWMTTYADAITLLMAFFVMMFAISDVNPSKYEDVKEALASQFSGADESRPRPEAGPAAKEGEKDPRGKTNSEGKGAQAGGQGDIVATVLDDPRLKNLVGRGAARVERSEKGILIEFSDTSLYAPGSVVLGPSGRTMLLTVAGVLDELKEADYSLVVEGHTDDVEPTSGSNWDVSSSRATGVVEFLIEAGVESWRMQASGFAHTQPRAPNRRLDGTRIPANQAKNRRVAIRVERPQTQD